MAKRTFIFISLLIVTQMVYSQKHGKNSLFPDMLIVNDVISIDSGFYTNFAKHNGFYSQSHFRFKAGNADDIGKIVVEKIKNNDFNIYREPYPDQYMIGYLPIDELEQLSKEDVLSAMGKRNEIRMIEQEDGQFIEKEYIKEPNPEEFRSFSFYENWVFDEKNFRFSKMVIAYSPIRSYTRDYVDENSEYVYKKTGFFVFPKTKNVKIKTGSKKQIYIGRIEYEFSLINHDFLSSEIDFGEMTELNNSPFFTSYARNQLRNALINKALNGKSSPIDFTSGKTLDTLEIQKRLGIGIEEVIILDENGLEKTIQVKSEFRPEEIKSVVFIEDWYLNPKNLQIIKKVVGIAPVRIYKNSEEQTVKQILFVMFFK